MTREEIVAECAYLALTAGDKRTENAAARLAMIARDGLDDATIEQSDKAGARRAAREFVERFKAVLAALREHGIDAEAIIDAENKGDLLRAPTQGKPS